jgi:hypothetical protein
VRAWFDRVEHHLAARLDQGAAADRARSVENEAKILARLIKAGISSRCRAAGANTGRKKRTEVIKRAARKLPIKFGKRAATGSMPRIQIKATAGFENCGGGRGIHRRPSLWSRNVAIYVRDPALGAGDLAFVVFARPLSL